MPEKYETIQEAMAVAEPGDTVFVAAGTYSDLHEIGVFPFSNLEAVVSMKPGVTLLGNPEAPETVVIQATDSSVGIFCRDADSTCSILGLTVTGGSSGIRGFQASPTIAHCRFVANQPASPHSKGGGMYGDYFSPTISDCVFADNIAPTGAGAAFASNSYPVLHRCLFTGNHAVTTPWSKGYGGALTIAPLSGAQLFDCGFTGNEADSVGGAFSIQDANVIMVGGTISDNVATLQGGGFFLGAGAVLQATECTIGGNTSPSGPDGFLTDGDLQPLATLICCDIDPTGWGGVPVMIDDEDCDQ